MKHKKDQTKELAKLQDQIAQTILEGDICSTVKELTRNRNIEMQWFIARIQNLILKQRSMGANLQTLLQKGESLVSEYVNEHGRDKIIAIQDQVILEPARVKIGEIDKNVEYLKTILKTIAISSEQAEQAELIRYLNLIK